MNFNPLTEYKITAKAVPFPDVDTRGCHLVVVCAVPHAPPANKAEEIVCAIAGMELVRLLLVTSQLALSVPGENIAFMHRTGSYAILPVGNGECAKRLCTEIIANAPRRLEEEFRRTILRLVEEVGEADVAKLARDAGLN